ncbi:MAG: CBS domain-containing protein [Gaiellales bacterium]|nr:MAG: CBS domain-containing protein [Gaiellales bacterium]
MGAFPEQQGFSDEDLHEALKELKGYVDVTESDLRKIYALAHEHARRRMAGGEPGVSEVMTRDVISVKAGAALQEVVELLTRHSISGLPVIDADGSVLGVVTESDILACDSCPYSVPRSRPAGGGLRRLARGLLDRPGRKSGGDTAGELMTSPAITVHVAAGLKEAAGLMAAHRVKRLPVVDDEGRLAGIISRADIVRTAGR